MLVIASFFAVSGCFNKMTTPDAVVALKDRSPFTRRDAADSIRRNNGPWPDAVPALLEAAHDESNAAAFGAELIALGASGSTDAETIILPVGKPALKRTATDRRGVIATDR